MAKFKQHNSNGMKCMTWNIMEPVLKAQAD